MGIIVYNYKDIFWIVTKFGAYTRLWLPYTCAKFQPDRSICFWVIAVFVFVWKEEYEENKTMVTRISEMAGAIYFKFGM